MANKNTPLRVIDMATAQNGSEGGVPVASEPLTTLAPRIDLIPGPTGLTISGQTTYRSTAAPQIAVRINWYPAPVYRFDYFIVEYDTNSSFTAPERVQTFQQNVTLVLKPSTTYYVRVSAAYEQVMSQWSSTLTVNTITDLTVPTAPGSLSLDWYRGDLYIVSPITNTDLVKDIRIQIWNAANTVQLDEVYSAAPYLFTAEENRRVHGGTPNPTVVVRVHSRGWNNVISASGIQQSTTSPAPGTITGLTTNWASDTGTESADCIASWNTDPQASAYLVQFNNDAAQVFNVLDGRYTYTWNQNAKAFPPSGQYTMPVRVWGINKLSQSGVAATVTHTNAAPTATGATLVAFAGFSQIIGQLTHAQINDVLQYRYSLVPASGTAVTYTSDSREVTLPIPSAGLWTLRANIIDRFGRASSNIDSSQFFSDSLTISGLRSAATYRDSQGTNPNTLNGLKDNILTTSIVAHNNTTAGSRWTEFSRPFVDRYRTTTLTTSGAMRFFLVASNGENGTKYYGGPLTGAYGNTLTEYNSLANAQTNYITHSGAITRYDLPAIMEARTITMYHWTGAGSYGLAEFYPRRLVQSDDIEAESIKSINIAAGNVTADKIFVLNLAAINIATGNLTISGVLTIAAGTGSGLYQGTGTFTSPTTGLKIWRDTNGIGRLTTYSGAIVQVDIATDGSLLAGAGNVILNKNGVQILSQSTTNAGTNAVSWFQTDPSNSVSTIYSYRSGGQNALYIESAANTASNQGGLVSALGIGASRTSFLTLKGNNVSGNDTTAVATLYSYRINLWGPAAAFLDIDMPGGVEIKKAATAVNTEVGHIELHDSATPAKYIYAGWDSNLNGGNGGGYIQSIHSGVAYYPTQINPLGGIIGINGGNNNPGRTLSLYNAASTLIGFYNSTTEQWAMGCEIINSNRFILYNPGLGYGAMMTTDGNMSIGVNLAPSSSTKLIVRGRTSGSSDNALAVQNSSGTNLILVRDDGASNGTVVAWTLISARETKKNIKKLKYGLAEVMQLEPKMYNMRHIKDNNIKFLGLVAEDVEPIIPEILDTLELDGKQVKSLRYNDLIPVLVNAVKELKGEVDTLRQNINAKA